MEYISLRERYKIPVNSLVRELHSWRAPCTSGFDRWLEVGFENSSGDQSAMLLVKSRPQTRKNRNLNAHIREHRQQPRLSARARQAFWRGLHYFSLTLWIWVLLYYADATM